MNIDGIDIEEKFDYVNYISPENDLSKYDIIVSVMNLTEANYHQCQYFMNTWKMGHSQVLAWMFLILKKTCRIPQKGRIRQRN